MANEIPAAGAASIATAAPLVATLAGAPWWLSVSLAASVTVLGCVYLVTQTWLAIERTRKGEPPAAREPRELAELRTVAEEPARLGGGGQ